MWARRVALAWVASACGGGRSPPGYAAAASAVETFLVYDLQRQTAKAWALLGRCDVDQASDTLYPAYRGVQFWRVATHDTVLVMVEWDVLGDAYRASPGDTLLTFRPSPRRIPETFAVTWDSAGKAVLACGLHQANHPDVKGFKPEDFSAADGSRANWVATRGRP